MILSLCILLTLVSLAVPHTWLLVYMPLWSNSLSHTSFSWFMVLMMLLLIIYLTVTLNEATVFPAKLYTHQHALTQKATLLEDLRSCSAATQDRTLA